MDFGLAYTPTADVITFDSLPDDQKLNMNVNNWNVNIIVSKEIFFVISLINASILNMTFGSFKDKIV